MKRGKRLFIPVNIFHKGFYSPSNQGERTQDIQINYGYLDIGLDLVAEDQPHHQRRQQDQDDDGHRPQYAGRFDPFTSGTG